MFLVWCAFWLLLENLNQRNFVQYADNEMKRTPKCASKKRKKGCVHRPLLWKRQLDIPKRHSTKVKDSLRDELKIISNFSGSRESQ